MQKQQIYAWLNLGFTLAVAVFYIITFIGWPSVLVPSAESVTSVLWKVIAVTFIGEIILDVMQSSKVGGVFKDERDEQIEGKAFRNAYFFLVAALFTLIGHIVFKGLIMQLKTDQITINLTVETLHWIVLAIFAASILKSSTQLYFYHKEELYE
jgi:hypothetical protein